MTPRTQLLSAITAAVVVTVAAVVLVRQELLDTLANESQARQEAADKLARKITALEGRLGALEAAPAPAPDTSAIDALRSELQTTKDTIAAQDAKLAALADKPAPLPPAAPIAPPAADATTAPLVAAIGSGMAYQAELAAWDKAHPARTAQLKALRGFASGGVPSEASLRDQFREIVARLDVPQQAAEEPKLVQRLNTHLAGLVSIKKSGEKVPDNASLKSLDSTASLEVMAARVDALPSDAQAPFLLWRDAVRTRAAAMAELTLLTALDKTS